MLQKRISAQDSHWAVLGVLRFFLAACVALGHFSLFVRHDPTHVFGNGILNPGSAVFGFMILSGYSIAASLTRDTKGFYLRRFVRIWPLYIATLAIGIGLAFALPNGFRLPSGDTIPPTQTISIVTSLLMLQTVIGAPLPMVGQIWSLCPEWWHYMIAPLLKKISSTWLVIWVALSFVAFMEIAPPPGHGIEGMSHGLTILVLSWQWVTGFVYFRLKQTPFGFTMLVLPSAVAAALGHFIGVPHFIAIFVLVLSEQVNLSKKVVECCDFLGDFSFPLYLFHIPAMVIALALGSNRTVTTLGAMFLLSLAALLAIDYPGRRLFRRKTRQAIGTSLHPMTPAIHGAKAEPSE